MTTYLLLPTEVWREWIIPLLPLRCLMRLDSASTNHQTRSHFLLGLSGSCTEGRWGLGSKREWDWHRRRLSFPSRISFLGRVTDREFTGLPTNIPQIREIHFPAVTCKITARGLGELLWSCSNLTKLEVNDCSNLTDDGILGLSAQVNSGRRLNYMKDLSINCHGVTDIGMIRFLVWMPNLTHLKLYNGQLSVETAQMLSEHCRSLQHLTVTAHHHTDLDEALLMVIRACTHLITLKVHHRLGASSETVILALAEHGHQLTTLWVPHSHAVTDRTLLALLRGCSQLTSLDITLSPRLTSEGIIAAIHFAGNLNELRVAENYFVTDAVVAAIAEHCPLLHIFDISRCTNLSVKSLWALRDHAHCLRFLHIVDNNIHSREVVMLKASYRERDMTLAVLAN